MENKIKAKVNTLDLADQLRRMEYKQSLLEEALRDQPISVASCFLTENSKIQPVHFELGLAFAAQVSESTKLQLPGLVSKNVATLLEASSKPLEVKGKRIGVLFSGGPAPGGHNVIAGLKAALGDHNTLIGIKAGPKGLLTGDLFEISEEQSKAILNTGGFDFLGSDRTKIKSKDQFEMVKNVVRQHALDGLVVVGGDDSNTNAAFLAESLMPEKCAVIGVPKTIDGDLQLGSLLPISFGFDTATKIYSEMVANILSDTPSSRKYWHFVKLMGRSASHVTLEVALQTHPTIALISEEVAQKNMTVDELISSIALVVAKRASQGKAYGVVVVPEGLIEFIPEFKVLIKELNRIVAQNQKDMDILNSSEQQKFVQAKLPKEYTSIFMSLPEKVRAQLLLERDSHGNLQVSQVPTEQLLVDMVAMKLKDMKTNPGKYEGKLQWTDKAFEKFSQFKFSALTHFLGYEGRCGVPSRFDASYTFNLGLTAGSLALAGHTGYMASVTDIDQGAKPIALPLAGLLAEEIRGADTQLVIEKALVKMDSPAFTYFASRREEWSLKDGFSNPGPRQFWGPVADTVPFTVALNQGLGSFRFNLGESVNPTS